MRYVEKFQSAIDDFALRLIFEDGDALDGTPFVDLLPETDLAVSEPEVYSEGDATTLIVVKVSAGEPGERAILRFVADTVAGRRIVEEIEIRVIT